MSKTLADAGKRACAAATYKSLAMMTRRHAARPLTALVFASAFASALGTAACDASDPDNSNNLAGELHTFVSDASGFDTRAFFYDTGEEVVVFDALFTEPLAEALVAEIAATTDSPITFVVITHPNPDKFNGVGPLRAAGATIVASEATAAAIPGVHAYKRDYFVGAGVFSEDTYPPQASVDLTFARSLRLPLASGAIVDLEVLDNPGVSSTQTVAHIPAIDALLVGDLVHHRAHAWLEGGIVDGAPRPDLTSWRAALAELLDYPETTVVYGGRGEPAPLASAVADQQRYLEVVEGIVRDYVDSLDDPVDALTGDDAGAHYAALTDAAKAAFPDYALDYMITYGVYGLALALAE